MNNTEVLVGCGISKKDRIIGYLKKGVWLYFILLIFEGALRKWFLPDLATPLLIIRDPLAIWMLYLAWKYRILRLNGYILLLLIVAFVSFIMSLIYGHGNISVAIYGIRILIVHFPLMFIIGKVFTQKDVLQMGKVILYISIPMIILIIAQFVSPQSTWVNRGVGGDMAGAGFDSVMGYFRPPGTFSFTTGNSLFWALMAPFVVYFWFFPQKINRILLIATSVILIISIPISIARTLMFHVGLTVFFAFIFLMRYPKLMWRFVIALFCISVVLMLISDVSLIQTGVTVFENRLLKASDSEGGLKGTLVDRFLGGMLRAITDSGDLPFWGHGLGMGTNAGAAMLTGKRTTFLISEEEWGRVIGETGIIMGLTFILIRCYFVFKLALCSYKKMNIGDPLPWLLLSFGFMVILQGQWAQPTVLGFSTLAGGLILSSFSKKMKIT